MRKEGSRDDMDDLLGYHLCPIAKRTKETRAGKSLQVQRRVPNASRAMGLVLLGTGVEARARKTQLARPVEKPMARLNKHGNRKVAK